MSERRFGARFQRHHKRKRESLHLGREQAGDVTDATPLYGTSFEDKDVIQEGLRTNATINPHSSTSKTTMRVATLEEDQDAIVFENEELVGSIATPATGATNFDIAAIVELNPGLLNSFPVGAKWAALFESYKFVKLVFRIRSRTAPSNGRIQGTWGMAIQYNADDSDYMSKLQMQQADYSVFGVTTDSLIAGVECDPKRRAISDELYIRYDSAPNISSLHTYDIGKLTVATMNTPNIPNFPLGELWVEYRVVFRKFRNLSRAVRVGEGMCWTMGWGVADSGPTMVNDNNWPNFITGMGGLAKASVPFQYGLPLPGWVSNPVFPNTSLVNPPVLGGDGVSYMKTFGAAADSVQVAINNNPGVGSQIIWQFNGVPSAVFSVSITLVVAYSSTSPQNISAIPTLAVQGDAVAVNRNIWLYSVNGNDANDPVYSWEVTVGSVGGIVILTLEALNTSVTPFIELQGGQVCLVRTL